MPGVMWACRVTCLEGACPDIELVLFVVSRECRVARLLWPQLDSALSVFCLLGAKGSVEREVPWLKCVLSRAASQSDWLNVISTISHTWYHIKVMRNELNYTIVFDGLYFVTPYVYF